MLVDSRLAQVDSVLVDASQLIGEGRGKDFCVSEYNADGLIFVYQTSFFLDDFFSWILFLVFILNGLECVSNYRYKSTVYNTLLGSI